MIDFLTKIFYKQNNNINPLKNNFQNIERNFISVQNSFLELDSDNYSKLMNSIQSNTFIFQNECNTTQFILQIDHFCMIRPKLTHLFLNLIKEFISEIKNKKIPADQIAPNIKNPHLIYLLYTENIINLDTIISLSSNNRFNYFEIFSDKIEQNDYNAFDYFLNFEKKKPKIEDNNDLKFNQIIDILKNDELETFIDFVSMNEINIDLFKFSIDDLNINEKYLFLELFEKIEQISLIEFAVMFGSEFIFKYLIANKVSIQNFSLISQLAVFSNNFNIIHILEDLNVHYDFSSLKIAIKCHHKELTEYIFSNYINFKELSYFDVLFECLSNYNYEFLFSHQEIFQQFENISNDKLSSLFQMAIKLKNKDFLKCLTDVSFNKSNPNNSYLFKNKIKIFLNNEVCSFQVIQFLYSNRDKFEIEKYNDYFAFSCQNGLLSISAFILSNEKRINVNFKNNKNGKNIIFSAVEHCCYNIVELLVKNKNVKINEAESNYGILI